MTQWRDSKPIWVSAAGTWTVRGATPLAWEEVFPEERAWHWAAELTPHVTWRYTTPSPAGWRWHDLGIHPRAVPVAMAMTSPYRQLPWNVRE